MKIGSFENKPLPSGKPADAQSKVEARRGDNAAGGEPSARVDLSSTAAVLAAPADGDFDAEKVARISAAIREGRFQVNAEAIADKLIEHAAELAGHRGS